MRLLTLLAASGVLAASCSAAHNPGAGHPTSTLPPSGAPTTQPQPQYAPSPFSWERLTAPALALGGGPTATLSAVLAPQLTGPWLMFGSRVGPSGSPTATVWSSSDARTWSAGVLSPASGASQARAAARFKSETVVVGSTGEGDAEQAEVWLSSATGGPFTAVSVPPTNGPSVMTMVAAGALGMFAAGTVDGRFAMWSSTNGRDWTELSRAEKAITSSPGARVNALMAQGDVVYAAGSVQPGAQLQAALWSTGDGLNWRLIGSAATSFAGPGNRVIYSLAPLGDGLVAVGAVDPGSGWVPASWISPDGQSWSLPSTDFPALPHPTAADSLGAAGGSAARSVAAIPTLAGPNAVVATGGGPYGQQAWRSSDGLHWTSLSLPAADAAATSWRAEVTAATTDRAVVVDAEPGQPYMLTDQVPASAGSGSGSNPPLSVPGAWSQPSSDPAVFGPVRSQARPVSLKLLAGRLQLVVDVIHRPQTIGPAGVTTVVLSSAGGTSWTAAPSGSAPPDQPPKLPAAGALSARLPTGWVAVQSSGGASVPAWSSAGGSLWTRTGGLSAATPLASDASTTTASAAPSGATGGPSVTVNGLCTARLPSATGGLSSSSTVAESVGMVTTVTTAAASAGAGAGAGGTPSSLTVTRSAAAWSSRTGSAWRYAAVGSPPPVGATSSLSGCVEVGSDLVAFGVGSSANGSPQPALWRSTDGTSWARVAVSAFSSGAPVPLVSLAADGQYWIAAANPDPGADPLQAGVAGGRGPSASAGGDAGVGPPPSVENGREALWVSANAGAAWQLIDTATAPWLGTQRSQIDLVAFATGTAVHTAATPPSATPVVVGLVDGQLAVWTGTPVSQPTGSGG